MRHRLQRSWLLGLGLALLVLATPAKAQLQNGHLWPQPRLTALTPCGGKLDTSVEVVIAGTEIEQPGGLHFSHPGLKATLLSDAEPATESKGNKGGGKKKDTQLVKFNIVIGKDVPAGSYDVRIITKTGVSNPRIFVVGDTNEINEIEPNNDIEQAQRVELGTTINGVISAPTDVDYSVFAGKKGQRVLIHCLSASIDSKLNPEIRMYDAANRELGYDRAMPNHDGLLDVTLPNDGDFFIRLNQFTYTAGSNEYFYRLNLNTGPWIDAVFPPVVEPGKATQVTLFGRNLPGGQLDPSALIDGKILEKLTVTINAPAEADRLHLLGVVAPTAATLDGFEYRLSGPTGTSNAKLIAFARAPVVVERDDNDTLDKAQEVTVPCEIAGRIDKKRDRDWYSFTAKKGDVFIIDVASQRLGAPTDMYVSVRNIDSKQEMSMMDDSAEIVSNRFYTANQDPSPYRFVAPADGKYHLLAASHTGDTFAGPHHIYRIRITPEKPDFRLFVMPADDFRPDALVVGQNGDRYYNVYVARLDGFKGEIALSLEGLPPGVSCPPQALANNVKFIHLGVSANDDAPMSTTAVKLVGSSVIQGQKVVHEARPASITWSVQPNNNLATITRLDRELLLAVRDKAPGRLVPEKDKFVITMGEKAEIPLKLIRTSAEFKANLQVAPAAQPNELPQGLTFANLNFAPGKDELKAVVTTTANLPPGTYNLVFRGFAAINSKGKPVNVIVNSAPVALTVLPKEVAKLSVDNGNPNIKAGQEVAVLVKVNRLFEYADSFKVELVLPQDPKGISAETVTIPPGANDVKLTLKVPPDTPPANVPNLVIRASAIVNGNVTLVHETKINVNIQK